MRALKSIKECSEMWVGYYFRTAAWFLDWIFSLLYCLKAGQTALTLLPVEVLMTLWPLISSLFLLSCCAPDFFSFFNILWRKANTWCFQLMHSYCVWGVRRIHKLRFPCSTVKYFWDAIWQISAAHLLMNDLPVGNWRLPEDSSVWGDF